MGRFLLRAAAAVAVLAIVSIVTYAVLFLRGGGAPREGSEQMGGVSAGISRTPKTYRIVYRVDQFAAGEHLISAEELRVRRVFDARLEQRDDAPPGGKDRSSQTSVFAKLSIAPAGTPGLIIGIPPSIATNDLRFDPVLDEAVEAGMLEAREVRRVADRTCRVYRSGGPISAGELVAVKEKTTEFADFCVDDAGLLLEEVWYRKKRGLGVLERAEALRRKLAVAVEEEVVFADSLFEVGDPTILLEQGGGTIRELKPDSRSPGQFWELEGEALGKFEHRGRYSVVPPQLDIGGSPPGGRANRIASVSDVYVRGDTDLVVFDRGSSSQGTDPFGLHPRARRIDLGPQIGGGEKILDFRANEVRARFDDGSFLRVYGTLPTQFLIAVAKTARRVEGGPMEFAE